MATPSRGITAINLMDEYLLTATEARQRTLRASPMYWVPTLTGSA
jgi:hypothetical protein